MRIKKFKTVANGELNINILNGRKVLDSELSNYSYGSLQKILKNGLDAIPFSPKIGRVLLLGLGGGSVIQTIREDFGSNCYIEAVEIDPVIIEIAKSEFHLSDYGNMEIYCADAAKYVEDCKDFYDLIIVDLFILSSIPEYFTTEYFISKLCMRVNSNGFIIFNTMRETMKPGLLDEMTRHFKNEGCSVNILLRLEKTNDLIIAKKE